MSTLDQLEGIFDPSLRLGVVSSVAASTVRANLQEAGAASGSLLRGARYGLGEVGEFVLVESEVTALLGRIIEVRLPERERRAVDTDSGQGVTVDAIAHIQLLGSVALDDLSVTSGVSTYPRLGDRVYSAPAAFLSTIPLRMEGGEAPPDVSLNIGKVSSANDAGVSMTPERLFGRHCAILGTTGGGKSYTVARLLEEALKYPCKLILLDATGEYRDLSSHTQHCYLGERISDPPSSKQCSVPPTTFTEGDFLALFEPSGKSQGPKLRSAIRSLRLIEAKPELAVAGKPGLLVRANRTKSDIIDIERQGDVSRVLDDPSTSFAVRNLVSQLVEECVYETGGTFKDPDPTKWGGYDGGTLSYCMTLLTRINTVLASKALECVFGENQGPSVIDEIDNFLGTTDRLLRISLEGIPFEFSAREIIANTLGRHLLGQARTSSFRTTPLIVFVDEAHNFLGRKLGGEDSQLRLDSFELIAKEGRKYGLCICLATQRPRDITEGVLSQMGTLIVHRLTNDRDRDVVERACGEIDRSASAFLPNLEPGEAAVVGVDFPIPLTIQVNLPITPPQSSGPDFQSAWGISDEPVSTDPEPPIELAVEPAIIPNPLPEIEDEKDDIPF